MSRHDSLSFLSVTRIQRNLVWAAGLCLSMFAVSQAPAVTIVAEQDTIITELAPDTVLTGANLTQIGIRSSSTSSQNAMGLVRFNLSTLTDDAAAAVLNLTANRDHNETYTVNFFGVYEDDAGAWSRAATTWNNAAITFQDGVNLATEIGDGSTALDQWDLVPNGDTDAANALVTALGSISTSADTDENFSFSSVALVNFLNAARANGDTTVTIVMTAEPHAHNIVFQVYGRDADTDDGNKPNLDITPVPEPASLALLGLGVLGVVRRRRSA